MTEESESASDDRMLKAGRKEEREMGPCGEESSERKKR